MYIINDMEVLERLNKYKILDQLAMCCSLSVSNIRLHDYSFNIRQAVECTTSINVQAIDRESFDAWLGGINNRNLTIGDLSSIYLTKVNAGSTIALSADDYFLTEEVSTCGLCFVQFDKLFKQMINDKKVIQLYDMIKIA